MIKICVFHLYYKSYEYECGREVVVDVEDARRTSPVAYRGFDLAPTVGGADR